MESKNVVYGEVARRLFDEALGYMERRMGWEFDDEIAAALENFFAECGLPLDNGLAYITDNIYVGGSYGFLEDLKEREAKRIKGLDKEEFVYWNEETGCFIERLY